MKLQNFPSRRRQIGGLFDSLFGSGEKTQETSQTISEDSRTTSRQTGTLTDTGAGTSKNVTTQLRGDVQDALNSFLLQQIGTALDPSKTGTDEISDIARLFAERSLGAEETIRADNAAIVANARRTGERQVGRLQADLAQQAGGTTGNSFVIGATAEGLAGLESSLAGLESELNTAARGIQTSEMQAAIEALRSGTADEATRTAAITSLVEALKGAQTTESGQTTSRDQRVVDLTDLTSAIGTRNVEGTTTESEDLGLFGSLLNAGVKFGQIASGFGAGSGGSAPKF